MKKQQHLIVIFFMLLIGWPMNSFAQHPFFKQKNDTLYFVLYFEKYVFIHEAFADFYYHSEMGSTFFSASYFVPIEKEMGAEYWDELNPEAPYGLVVYYNGKELMRQDTTTFYGYIAEVAGAGYSSEVLPDWLEGNWAGMTYSRNHTNQVLTTYSFNKSSDYFEVEYPGQRWPIKVIIDSVANGYVRCLELNTMGDETRKFGSWHVEIKYLEETNQLYVKYPPYEKDIKLGIGFLNRIKDE
jgi:hypothetical protein